VAPSSVVVALCAAWLPAAALAEAAAQPPGLDQVGALAEAAAPPSTPSWFDLTVNGVPRGQVLVRLGTGDAWVAVEDLQRAGLTVVGGQRIVLGGRTLVSLGSLAPAIGHELDLDETVLRLTSGPELLGRTTLDLNPRKRPARLSRHDVPSAFLNLGARSEDRTSQAASAELGLSAGPWGLRSNGTWRSAEGFLRGLTEAHLDDPDRLLRYSAGELFATSQDPLGGAALLLGGAAGREFSLDPYLLLDPYPRTSLLVDSPSTLEVWVGDTLVRRTRVDPGTLDLENLPLYSGVNEVRTVLRDAFGREQSASSFFVMGTNLLPPGLVDWGASAGLRRLTGADGRIAYGEGLAAAHWRRGLTRLLTVGARAEGGPSVANAGASVGLATPLGDLEAGAAASRAGAAGSAGYLGWRSRLGPSASVAGQVRLTSDRYATMSLAPGADRSILRAHLGASVSPVPRLSFLAELAAFRQRDEGSGARGALRAAWTYGGGQVAASTALASQSGQPRAWEFLVSWSLQLREAHSVEVGARTGSAGEGGWITATRGMGIGPGWGYRVDASAGDGAVGGAELYGQTTFAWAAIRERWLDPWTGQRAHHEVLEAATSLVLIDEELHLSRPAEGSYTLVVLEGAPGVRVSLDGQPVGATNAAGRLFIPGLLPYYGNRVAIRDSDLPLDFEVSEVERLVAPRYRAGTVERFDVRAARVAVGKVRVWAREGDVVPEWGEVAVDLPAGRSVSPVGSGGAFWLEGLPPGRHRALLRWDGRSCWIAFDVPERAGIADVGTRYCAPLPERGEADPPAAPRLP
jgi:outer membrane usher protein